MKKLYFAIFIPFLFSCVSPPPKALKISTKGLKDFPARLLVLSGSTKIRKNEFPHAGYTEDIVLHSARGESESRQVLVFAGERDIENAEVRIEWIDAPPGDFVSMELGLIEYVPVKKSGLRSFGKRGLFPDPIVPIRPFTVKKGENRTVHLTAHVQREAPVGEYTGTFYLEGGEDISLSLPIELNIWPTVLPVESTIKTSIHWREGQIREERYYGEKWTEKMSQSLHDLSLRYRINSRPRLDWEGAIDSGNWEKFNRDFLTWREKGYTSFEVYVPFSLRTDMEELKTVHLPRLALLNNHLVDQGWTDYFYLYFFDEPSLKNIKKVAAYMAFVKESAPDIRQLYTYGTNRAGERHFLNLAGVWVPNIHQFNERFARDRQKAGDEYWIYTCIGNVHRRYPDNFRLDWYGASHRALGWWLFLNKIDGYLYWGLDYWQVDPWESAETFPYANGDGSLFYPDPEKRALPFPSLRIHAMRDTFEDHDLLMLLREKAFKNGGPNSEEARLLSGEGICDGKKYFNTDDSAYDRRHYEILKALAQYEED